MRLRFSLRFILPLIFTLALIAYSLAPVVDRLIFQWFVRDIDIRAELIANAMHDSLARLMKKPSEEEFQRLAGQVITDERLYGMAFCDSEGRRIYKTPGFPDEVKCGMRTGAGEI